MSDETQSMDAGTESQEYFDLGGDAPIQAEGEGE